MGPLPVPELGIKHGSPCKHLCESGCGDYENRIDVCHTFSCAWKTNFVPDRQRPDRSGLICKWVDDGSLLLVPTTDNPPQMSVEFWKSFARKMKQSLGIWDRKSEKTTMLIRKREKAFG